LKPREQVERIARATGGRVFYLQSDEGASETATKIVGSLRHQYEITYAPTSNKQNGKLRKLKVVVTPKDGRQLNVITRQGYFGPGHKRKSEKGDGMIKS